MAKLTDPLAKVKLVELDEAIALCAGLWAEAQSRTPETSPGVPLTVTTTLVNRSRAAAIGFEGAAIEGMWNEALPNPAAKLADNQRWRSISPRPSPRRSPTQDPTACQARHQRRLHGRRPAPGRQSRHRRRAHVRLRFTLDGVPFELLRPVHYRYASRAEGERERPLVVVPPAAVNLPESVAIFPSAATRKVHVAVRANIANVAGTLRLDAPAGWKVAPRSLPFQIAVVGEQQEMAFDVTPPAGESVASMRAVATVGGREIAYGMETIDYPHIPIQTLFPPSTVKLVRTDIKVTAKKVGYIIRRATRCPTPSASSASK